MSPRPLSTKTRIKTLWTGAGGSLLRSLQDHFPLKQGLRHCTNDGWNRLCRAPRPLSTKTRIKTLYQCKGGTDCILQDHFPLKQGLRLSFCQNGNLEDKSPRPLSTKTRIKTLHNKYESTMIHIPPRPLSTKTRIKTLQCLSQLLLQINSKTTFH